MDDYKVVLQKDGQFIGHGTTDEGIHIEGFLFKVLIQTTEVVE